MSHIGPIDEHKSQLLIVLGTLFAFLSVLLLLSSVEREISSLGEAKAGSSKLQTELASPTNNRTTPLPTLTPTAYSVALPEIQGGAVTTAPSPSNTPSPTATSSPSPVPSPTATPSVTASPGLRRPTRVPRPTPGR